MAYIELDIEAMTADRLKGMSLSQIARKYYISQATARNRVGHIKVDKVHKSFQRITKQMCIYVNLRKWMNEHEVGIIELNKMVSGIRTGSDLKGFRKRMRGIGYPRKDTIDKFIEITGLTYEQLFEVG